MAGELFTLNEIYNKVVTSSESNNQKQIWFYAGRAFYYLARFEPVEFASIVE